MEKEERNRKYKEQRFDEIQNGMIAALRASGELAGSGIVTTKERRQLRLLNGQLKFYMQKVGSIKNNSLTE